MIYIISHIFSACLDGFNPFEVRIECYIGRGLPNFKIVGLPDASVREAMDRIYSAIRTSNLEMPCAKVVVNLSPSDLRKGGTHLDLPICLALLAAMNQQMADEVVEQERTAYFGELSLYGDVVQTPGLIPLILGLSQMGFTRFVVPWENILECQIIKVGKVIGVHNVQEALDVFTGRIQAFEEVVVTLPEATSAKVVMDFADVQGCEEAKRVMEIAAAGRHHALLLGAPGTGKTMLVSRLAGILPEPTWEEVLEITRIHSMAGIKRQGLVYERPFRNPHYTIAQAGFIGGYTRLIPGEVSLAHNGILFLDEVTEFKRDVLESLRTLLDQRAMVLRRGNRYYEIPCDFLLMAAANPCPCGYFGSHKLCTCRQSEREKYLGKISGPVADRIDLKIIVGASENATSSGASQNSCYESPAGMPEKGTTASMRNRVQKAWAVQKDRNSIYGVLRNSDLQGSALYRCCGLTTECLYFFKKTMSALSVSRRSEEKILRVARTIADLDGKMHVDQAALREAIFYNGNLERSKI